MTVLEYLRTHEDALIAETAERVAPLLREIFDEHAARAAMASSSSSVVPASAVASAPRPAATASPDEPPAKKVRSGKRPSSTLCPEASASGDVAVGATVDDEPPLRPRAAGAVEEENGAGSCSCGADRSEAPSALPPSAPSAEPSSALALTSKRRPQLGRRLRVWWVEEQEWFAGTIREHDLANERHTVVYDDGDQQSHRLEDPDPDVTWEFVDEEEVGQ